MSNLDLQIKQLIIDSLNLEDITPDEIDSDAPLFGDGLGLDSIDALELGVAIKKTFNIALTDNSEENREHFASVNALVALVEARAA
ncbi:phosphopantetheine-binding protein [Oceanobacter kriegii]|uniref:phosphopantetheine-binding protein n=1 Tax=Oceanobacter kriegii TaxID=64972 RepID=UPI0003FAFCC9|nr:phosphopantetheine-binding protein [Oceanobacter kriegii]